MSRKHAIVFLPLTSLLFTLPAFAAQPEPTAGQVPASGQATSPSSSPATPDRVETLVVLSDDFKPVALTLNPLSLILGRIGLNVEWLPARHHALIVNPYFQSISADSGSTKTSFSNFGGEIGYRYYSGNKGANGFFIGPALLFQQSNTTTTSSFNGSTTSSDASLSSYGAALDVGGQHVFNNGLTIGGGAGLMYLAASSANVTTSSTVKIEGVLPRFLFTVGYSF